MARPGTESSNPSPSSGESGANLISGRNVFDDPGSGPWFGRFDLLAQRTFRKPDGTTGREYLDVWENPALGTL